MVHNGLPSHKVWTDWSTRPLNPSSEARAQGRVMWDPGRVTVKELRPGPGPIPSLWIMDCSTRLLNKLGK
jgi:hypothetical protein